MNKDKQYFLNTYKRLKNMKKTEDETGFPEAKVHRWRWSDIEFDNAVREAVEEVRKERKLVVRKRQFETLYLKYGSLTRAFNACPYMYSRCYDKLINKDPEFKDNMEYLTRLVSERRKIRAARVKPSRPRKAKKKAKIQPVSNSYVIDIGWRPLTIQPPRV